MRAAPMPPHGGPARALALRAPQRDAELEVRAPGAALGMAEAALARAAGDRRAVLRRPGRDVPDRPRREAAARPLVLDRPRHEDPRARGRDVDRRQVGARPGVHDLRLPARLDRARVHRRRPRDADRLRPRRRRGRAADPPAGDLQARRQRRAQLLDRLRRVHPARRHGRRQLHRRREHRRDEGRRRRTRSSPAPRARAAHARGAGAAALALRRARRSSARATCRGPRAASRPTCPAPPRAPSRDRPCRPSRAMSRARTGTCRGSGRPPRRRPDRRPTRRR